MSENATIYSPNLNSKKIRPDKDLPKDNNKILTQVLTLS